ncbi:MAG: hypothetical protein ACR652_22695 [Methylocystis sp.]|uniref:hypothetical protein n=1 Tax=Methylocystis sp. TaxID=1911079 RepID=UPI003DA6756A
MSITNTTPLPLQIVRQDQEALAPETVGRHPETGATIAVEARSGRAPVQESQAELQTRLTPEAHELQQQLDRPATVLTDRVGTAAPSPSCEINHSESNASRPPGARVGDPQTERIIQELISQTPFRRRMHRAATEFLITICASRAPEAPDERGEFLAGVVQNMAAIYLHGGPLALKEAMQDVIAASTGSYPAEQLEAQSSVDEVGSEKVSPLDSFLNQLEAIPFSPKSSSKFVQLYGRVVVAAKFGNFRMPFYLSSGETPKTGIEPGKWYPFFGVGSDFWFNKVVNGMPNYYGSPKLKDVARKLDTFFGDIRDNSGIPEVSDERAFVTFINKSMDPVAHKDMEIRDCEMNMHMVELLNACDDTDTLYQKAVAAAQTFSQMQDEQQGSDSIEHLARRFVGMFMGEATPEDKRNQ